MSLLGRVKEYLDSLRSLARWLENREDSSLSTFVADAVRFVQAYFSVIAGAPLQIYICLMFAPSESVMRRTFEHTIPKWIINLPKVKENWDAYLLTLEGHGSLIRSVVFSHDSNRVASGSDDETIRIWNAETGEYERVLEGHSNEVSSVVFSHDSKRVASGSDDKTIRIWNAETCECERVLEGHSSYVNSVVFSHDSKKVTSGSYDMTIRIWNAETDECEYVVPLDTYTHVISFTPDSCGIVTNCGVFTLTDGLQSRIRSAMPSQFWETPILACAESTWVTAAGKDLLWLPPECRNGVAAVSGSTFVIGCQSGRVVLLEISIADMEQWTST
ncbi:uncharacterized protein FTOL_02140 [Fusarium torulosum]|uniref:Mitochondrial division protein 1 n=1 Tax=Fusarium torulosum TaxID=33205 RepID=A0AAE8M1J1_9HYPO|nr:uncharacterized protein FTOL_02140 [Fusarium torulosum]